jgi:hypothetical protein
MLVLSPVCLIAQADTTKKADSTSMTDAIKAFLDCQGDTSLGCDTEFFVLEMPFVTWTRDRLFADVQFLVTTIQTGSGSFTYTVTALGRGRFAGRADTAVVRTIPNEAEDPIRRKLAATFKVLLVPYVRSTALADRVRVEYDVPKRAGQLSPQSVKDKWNFFVISASANGFVSSESQQTTGSFFGNLRVRRTTESSSLRFGVNQNSRFSKFEIDDSTTFSNTVRSGTLFARGVKALSSRLSLGAITSLGYSEFNNTELVFRAAPVIEYNFFPWSQATSQQIAISYGVGPRYFKWTEPTIYGKSNEFRMQQELVVGSDIRKSWGSVNVSGRYASFIPDAKKWNLSFNGETNLNLVKGLQFNIGGGASLIRDQIFLSASGRTRDQILTQQRALASNYNLFFYTGLSYSFGSIYNSVVNPRMEFFNLGGGN